MAQKEPRNTGGLKSIKGLFSLSLSNPSNPCQVRRDQSERLGGYRKKSEKLRGGKAKKHKWKEKMEGKKKKKLRELLV